MVRSLQLFATKKSQSSQTGFDVLLVWKRAFGDFSLQLVSDVAIESLASIDIEKTEEPVAFRIFVPELVLGKKCGLGRHNSKTRGVYQAPQISLGAERNVGTVFLDCDLRTAIFLVRGVTVSCARLK